MRFLVLTILNPGVAYLHSPLQCHQDVHLEWDLLISVGLRKMYEPSALGKAKEATWQTLSLETSFFTEFRSYRSRICLYEIVKKAMDKSQFPAPQTWSAVQVEQVRTFLQVASQIPSSNSIQEVLQREATQPPFQGHSQNIAGASSGNILNTGCPTGNFCGPSHNPVAQPSHIISANMAGSSIVPSSLTLPVPDGVSDTKYPEPDVDAMLFDFRTGYRFDQSTGLYYDANAGLFVNKQLNALLQWNPVISTYTVVGRASDVAAPALAQDLARLVERGKITVASSTLNTTPVPKPSIPSWQEPIRGTPSFQREWSLDFEEMSPDREEVVSDRRELISVSIKRSPDLGKYDVHNVSERSRSLSFDEMTPERDTDDFSMMSVFPREHRSPSRSPRRDTSGSPRRTRRGRRDQDSSCSPGMRNRSNRDSNGWRSPGRYRKSPRCEYSRSPRRNYSESPSPERSRRRHSPLDRSRRRASHEKRPYPRRDSRLSPSSLRSQYQRLSPDYNRRRSPEIWSRRSLSSNEGFRRRLSPGISWDSEARPGDSGDRRFHRSPSPAHHFGRRQKNDYTERGETSRGRRRRSRSRSPYIVSRNKPRRSTSRSRTNLNHLSKSTINSRRSRSPLGGKKAPRAEPKLLDESYYADSPPSPLKNDAPTGGLSTVVNAAKPEAIPLLPGSITGFSRRFMEDTISRINKTNLRNPGNIYGRLLPHPVTTLFIMLTPLPPKGDREWKDLEILLTGMLKAEGVRFWSVTVFPGDEGAPCNYCLIRFKDVEEAFRWYVVHDGSIDLSGPDGSTCQAFMNFIQNNWKCKKCRTQNFALRNFCHKCFWSIIPSKTPPIQVSQLVTEYVGIAGLDCRFLSVNEVLTGFPPLDSFNIETFELLTEPTGIPVGLAVFKFKEKQESAAFYRFLRESCLNPIFLNIINRTGLGVNPILGHLLKRIATAVPAPSNPLTPGNESAIVSDNKVTRVSQTIVFPNPPKTDHQNNPLLWWRSVAGYVPEEGGDIMKYLFEEHPDVNIAFESAHAQILVGPLPIPLVCDLMEYRDMLSRFLQSTGVATKHTEKVSICKAHHFGAPYNYSLLRFDTKKQTKNWFEKMKGKLILRLENGSTWSAHLHYSRPNWSCPHCHKLNFPLRIQCFSCYKPRLSDHTPVSFKKNPTIFIGITGYQNWCATEELLFRKLKFLCEIKNLTVSYLNEPTGIPLGICVLKSATPAASQVLFNKLQEALTNEIARASIQQPNRPLLVYIV